MKKLLILCGMLASTATIAQDYANPHGGAGANPHGANPHAAGGVNPHAGINPHTGMKPSATTNKDWWPNQLNVGMLRQNSEKSNPMGPDFNYIKAFKSLDYFA